MITNIVVFGATSAIAHETVKHFANSKCSLVLLARNSEHLQQIAADLTVRGASKVKVIVGDLDQNAKHLSWWNESVEFLGHVDLIYVAHGYLGEQKSAERSWEEASKIFNTNTISYLSILSIAANYFEQRKQGCIAAITSVAGDRGRQSNYIYGASKAAVISLLQGMRNRLYKSNVQVIDLRPGFVKSPMTKNVKSGLMVGADKAGKIIYKAIVARKAVVYVPFRWQIIMTIIKMIPEKIFVRLSL